MICQRTSTEPSLLLLSLSSILSGESRHQSTVVRVFLEQDFQVTRTGLDDLIRMRKPPVPVKGNAAQSYLRARGTNEDTDCIEYHRLTEYTKIPIHDAQIRVDFCFEIVRGSLENPCQ